MAAPSADVPGEPTWADLEQLQVAGGIRLTGTCPECGDVMSTKIPYGVLGGTRKGVTSSPGTPPSGEWATVLCRCKVLHRDGKPGCGGHGYVWLRT